MSASETYVEQRVEAAKRHAASGNLAVKAGVLLCVLGIGFLVKEAAGVGLQWLAAVNYALAPVRARDGAAACRARGARTRSLASRGRMAGLSVRGLQRARRRV